MYEASMESLLIFQIMGPLRVLSNGNAHVIKARKVKTLLAVLLIRANQIVSMDQLFTELWGDSPPRRASAGVHVYVSQLRKFLMESAPGQDPLITRAPGYLLEVGSEDLDLLVFRRLVQKGRTSMRARRYEEAFSAFSTALDMCQGSALDDLRDSESIARFAAWLEELRLECTELLVESNFYLGRHREMVGFLYGMIGDHPLHEPFYRQLMLALYRCERRADALQVYQSARATITSELGLEPCRTLREMQHAILCGDDGRLAG
jgi:DNA-binding SARP family transcriptional activator